MTVQCSAPNLVKNISYGTLFTILPVNEENLIILTYIYLIQALGHQQIWRIHFDPFDHSVSD